MKSLGAFFSNLFGTLSAEDRSEEAMKRRNLYREWDKQRARAISPSDLAEIDAIFSRH